MHRLVALASRWEELIAPEWTRFKMTTYQKVIDYLNANGIVQGNAFSKKDIPVKPTEENFQNVAPF